MNSVVCKKIAESEMQKEAIIGTAAKGILKGLNWGATKGVEGAWGATKGVGNLARKHPWGAINTGFGISIVGGGLSGHPRVPQRSLSSFIPQMQGGAK